VTIDGKVHNASTYVNHGCRCDVCRESHAAAVNRRRKERKAQTARLGLPSYVQHGVSAYANWGCHCVVCRDDWNAYYRAHTPRSTP